MADAPSEFLQSVLTSAEPYGALGHWVKAQRDARDWSQEELARRLSLSRASVANLESGRQRILFHTFVTLASLFWSEPPPRPRAVVGKGYISACDCPTGWVTCNREPCARAEAIMAGIRAKGRELAANPEAAHAVLVECGAIAPANEQKDGAS